MTLQCYLPFLSSSNGNSSSWSSLGLEGEAGEERMSFSPSDRLVSSNTVRKTETWFYRDWDKNIITVMKEILAWDSWTKRQNWSQSQFSLHEKCDPQFFLSFWRILCHSFSFSLSHHTKLWMWAEFWHNMCSSLLTPAFDSLPGFCSPFCRCSHAIWFSLTGWFVVLLH